MMINKVAEYLESRLLGVVPPNMNKRSRTINPVLPHVGLGTSIPEHVILSLNKKRWVNKTSINFSPDIQISGQRIGIQIKGLTAPVLGSNIC
jgi:hypothetical protein